MLIISRYIIKRYKFIHDVCKYMLQSSKYVLNLYVYMYTNCIHLCWLNRINLLLISNDHFTKVQFIKSHITYVLHECFVVLMIWKLSLIWYTVHSWRQGTLVKFIIQEVFRFCFNTIINTSTTEWTSVSVLL